jgi:beta-glucanase (GH16 family)
MPPSSPTPAQAGTPAIQTTAQQNGAVTVALSSATTGAAIYYTTDGTTPTVRSQPYLAPFLVASNITVKAIAAATGFDPSTVASQAFSPNLPSGTLVWAEEFDNSTSGPIAPNRAVWAYDTGNSGFGNSELETYCANGSTTSPCDTANPNAYVGTDGVLHIVARQPSPGVYTSARLKTQGLFSFQYGRLEFRARVPEAQGFWPAGWLMGNTIATLGWPASGEMDVLERANAALVPDWNGGSIHGTGFTGANLGAKYNFPSGQTASDWHVYGMIWKPGSVAYYIDSPSNVYASFTPSSLSSLPAAAWPFDSGPSFMLLNLAVGGSYPGPPDATTPFPSEYDIDYVRLYTN